MPKITVSDHKIKIGSKSISLLSGEVHYWRLSPDRWQAALKQVKAMGLSVVATYIPWQYHEVTRGKFDFHGKTEAQRNLKAFLDLVQKEKLYLIIRPGPYIYSEWKNDGVPDYAHKYHRLHPKFKEFSEKYIRQVLKVIKPYFASTNPKGNIVLLQADNEIDPWPDLFGNQYGFGDKPGMFQEFLKKKYKNIAQLNEQWGTKYSSFNKARVFISQALENQRNYPLTGEKESKRVLDGFEFKHEYSYEYAKWNVGLYKKLGVDIPMYLNVYPFLYAHDWEKMNQLVDLVGIDIYPNNELKEDIYEPRKVMDKIRYLRTFSKVAYIAEFQSGVWHNRNYEVGPLTPKHYRMLCLSVLLAGCQGWNWYMLVNRDNWYMSPINEWAEARPELYDVFQQMVDVFKKIDATACEKLSRVAVTYNRMQYTLKSISSKCPTLHSLYQSDVDYEFFDTKTGSIKKDIVFYSGNQWLDSEAQKNLLDYVKKGGTLVLFQDFPRKDDSFNALNLLGLSEPSSILFEFKTNVHIQLDKTHQVSVESQPMIFENVTGTKIQSTLGKYGKKTIGYIKKIGKGKVCHLGVQPNSDLIKQLLDYFGVQEYAQSSSQGIKTALFQRGSKHFLIAVNITDEEQSVQISLNLGAKSKSLSKAKNLVNNTSNKVQFGQFVTQIPARDGAVFEIS